MAQDKVDVDIGIDEITEDAEDAEMESIVESGTELIAAIFERKPFNELKALIDQEAPLWYQDEEGNSALHAAVYNEDSELVRLLIEKGAVWNAVDNLGYTAGDVAVSLNNEECYRLIRDAGIRSEYLLSHLSSKKIEIKTSSSLVIRSSDDTAAGSSTQFLSSPLIFKKDSNGEDICMVKIGDEEVGVMMGWERGISMETVNQLCVDSDEDFSVLNVGFGLGIFDSLVQARPNKPTHHYIIEAHPDVLKHMRKQGWYDKPGVKILEGKWQDYIESEELLSLGGFDVVYTDTFSENYQDLQDFFEHLPDILSGPQARFSFFNGLGATNALFYDVYTQLSELHLSNVGITVTWSDVDVAGDQKSIDKWAGTRNYFGLRLYRLPIGRILLAGS